MSQGKDVRASFQPDPETRAAVAAMVEAGVVPSASEFYRRAAAEKLQRMRDAATINALMRGGQPGPEHYAWVAAGLGITPEDLIDRLGRGDRPATA